MSFLVNGCDTISLCAMPLCYHEAQTCLDRIALSYLDDFLINRGSKVFIPNGLYTPLPKTSCFSTLTSEVQAFPWDISNAPTKINTLKIREPKRTRDWI